MNNYFLLPARKGGRQEGKEGRERRERGGMGEEGKGRRLEIEPMRAKEQREAQEKDVTKPEMGAKGKG